MRAWENLEGCQDAILVHVLRDGDVSSLRIELDPLPAPHALEATLGDGRPPDMQPTPRRRDLNVGAFVVREKSTSGLVGDAVLIEAPVEVDTGDAVSEDEAEGCAGGARGLIRAPGRRVGDGCPRARARAHGSLVGVVDPSGAADELDGQRSRGMRLCSAVVSDSASGRAETCVSARPGFERNRTVFACSHVSYCNG